MCIYIQVSVYQECQQRDLARRFQTPRARKCWAMPPGLLSVPKVAASANFRTPSKGLGLIYGRFSADPYQNVLDVSANWGSLL